MSLFSNLGSSTTTTTKPNLFGSLNTGVSQAQQSPSLFGPTATQNQAGSTFGQSTNDQAKTPFGTSSLFGQPAQSNQQTSSLFGQPAQQQNTQQTSSLFGQPAQQNTQQTSSLFGQPAQANAQQNTSFGGSLFGSAPQNQPQQQGNSILGSSMNQQQPALGASMQQSRLGWNPGASLTPREKSIPEQIETLFKKWNPTQPECVFQHYFYNNVNPATVPYYAPGPDEDVSKWEEALAKKPSEGSIPVLGKGFAMMGERLQLQYKAVTALQSRMHEINNSLTAMMQAHELQTTTRAQEARRKHIALSQRTLALATRVQVLRNRGYAMDGAEEELKSKLQELEKKVFDPARNGVEEEIWARMVQIREKARWLQEETERVGHSGANASTEIDEDVLNKTKKILSDYDSQLTHLKKELDSIKGDFDQWHSNTHPEKAGMNGTSGKR